MTIFSDNIRFLGVPFSVWGGVCLLIGAVYTIFWPRPQASRLEPRPIWMHLILRWTHAVVWLLLAAASFALAAGYIHSGRNLASLALAVYFVFMGTLLVDRRGENVEGRQTDVS
jgi:small-conductance mechanosensitive channel